jgi:hypothetical protein
MNNIKELAEKAGWVDWTDDDNWIYPPAKESGYFVLADLEKFAELIIKQCVKLADDNYNSGFCPVGGAIEDYFGVKK